MKPFSSSFRDPHGFLFTHEGQLYRGVTDQGKKDFDLFLSSGLYDELVRERKLIRHEEVKETFPGASFYKILRPQPVPFVSYPYEWTFSALKDAALLTLDIQKKALKMGLSLKDASFFNIQFIGSNPVFIDTLSFEERGDTPWVAYRQFCQHFLGPLLLMQYAHLGINRHLQSHLDGFPLSLAADLLPLKAKMRPGIFMHIVMHSFSQKKYKAHSMPFFGLKKQLALVDHLEGLVEGLAMPAKKSGWSHYVEESSHYSPGAMLFKKDFVSRVLTGLGNISSVWDLGGNTGEFARLSAERGIMTICFDQDPVSVERNYREARLHEGLPLLPLVMDLANPTPAIGWGHTERMSLLERGKADLVLALALIHHLRISAGIPVKKIVSFLSECANRLIIEFIPKEDPMTSLLLAGRRDIFDDYTQDQFEASFLPHFSMAKREPIPDSKRILYFFEKK